jgi:hypothetical protein
MWMGRLEALSATGELLDWLSAVVDFELFRPVLDAALVRSDRSKSGGPPYDAQPVKTSVQSLADRVFSERRAAWAPQ